MLAFGAVIEALERSNLTLTEEVARRSRIEDALREGRALLRIAGRTARLAGEGERQDDRLVRDARAHEVPEGHQPTIQEALVFYAPELLATKPKQLWSCDITKLLGPEKWSYFYLYVILVVFSRYVAGWLVADAESSALAQKLISQACERQGIAPGQLIIHADRGSSMKSNPSGDAQA